MNKSKKLRRVQVGDYTKSRIFSSRRFVLKRRLRLYSRIAFDNHETTVTERCETFRCCCFVAVYAQLGLTLFFWAKSAVHRFRQGRSGIGWDTRAGVRRGNPDREVRYELHT